MKRTWIIAWTNDNVPDQVFYHDGSWPWYWLAWVGSLPLRMTSVLIGYPQRFRIVQKL